MKTFLQKILLVIVILLLQILSYAQDKTLYNYIMNGVQIASTPQASPATVEQKIVYQYSGGFVNLQNNFVYLNNEL